MYQLPNKPKGRNLDFLTSYHDKLRELYNYEKVWDSMEACGRAESFIYKFKDTLPYAEKIRRSTFTYWAKCGPVMTTLKVGINDPRCI